MQLTEKELKLCKEYRANKKQAGGYKLTCNHCPMRIKGKDGSEDSLCKKTCTEEEWKAYTEKQFKNFKIGYAEVKPKLISLIKKGVISND